MRMILFAQRTSKEILRDPLSLGFGVGFPLILLFLLSSIQSRIPVPIFEISHLAPGLVIFGLTFITLFSAILVARDRESAFLSRLYTTPLTYWEMVGGYFLPLLPMALIQSLICYSVASLLGLRWTIHLIPALGMLLPIALFFISFGLLWGSLLTSKQVSNLLGAVFTNVAAWLSGTWFDLDLMGGTFKGIAEKLPFYHAVQLERCLIHGDPASLWAPHFLWVMGYGLVSALLALHFFLRQMKNQ